MKRNLRLDYYCGILGSIGGVLFWLLLISSTTEKDVFYVNMFWAVLPAILSIISLYYRRPFLMALAFIINLPIGLYLLIGANNYFVIFALTPFLYLISFIIMVIRKRDKREIS